MWQYTIKVAVSAIVIVAVSEIAKRSTWAGALLASLPLTSVLAFVWLHMDGAQSERVAALSQSIFWLVLPSLVLFLVLPVLLRAGWGFWASLGAGCAATFAAYGALAAMFSLLGIRIE